MTQLWTTGDFAARNGSQDSNQIYSSSQVSLPQYSNENEVYLNSAAHAHYSAMAPSYSSYSGPYVPSQNSNAALMYMPSPVAVSMPYQLHPPSSATLPSQPRPPLQNRPFYQASVQPQRGPQTHHGRLPGPPEISLTDTEEQDSPNNETMRSEPICPALDGYPNVEDFDELMKQYVQNLSPKKQDKALIHARRAANIKAVLIDKKTTAVESAQFRFWVKKMFTLEPRDPAIPVRKRKICHEGKPVAVREKLFKILTKAHKQCQHGGRDKTSAQVRRVYSWVPKELISRFVKLCPTCQVRRGVSRTSPSASENSVGTFMDAQSPELSSSGQSRRGSLAAPTASGTQSPLRMSRFSSAFQQQNRWMTPAESGGKGLDRVATLENSASTMVNMDMNSPISLQNTNQSPKCPHDSESLYMPPTALQTSDMTSHYHQAAMNMQNMQNMHHHHHHHHHHRQGQGHSYRYKQDPMFKQEQRY